MLEVGKVYRFKHSFLVLLKATDFRSYAIKESGKIVDFSTRSVTYYLSKELS
jgi:hypothetical protein